MPVAVHARLVHARLAARDALVCRGRVALQAEGEFMEVRLRRWLDRRSMTNSKTYHRVRQCPFGSDRGSDLYVGERELAHVLRLPTKARPRVERSKERDRVNCGLVLATTTEDSNETYSEHRCSKTSRILTKSA